MYKNSDKIIIRLPDGMRDELHKRAKANHRSMNAEVVFYLEQALGSYKKSGTAEVVASPRHGSTNSREGYIDERAN